MTDSSEKLQLAFIEGLCEQFKKEASEETGEDVYREEELPAALDPFFLIR